MAMTSSPATSRSRNDVLSFLQYDAFGETKRIDTHAAHIFLTQDRAWKMKQPVDLGFLDFSTPDKRRIALEAELHLNRRTAPDLYLAIHPLTRDGSGALQISGNGVAVDWLLEMRRFPDEALLETIAAHGALDTELLLSLADTIADFHGKAEIALIGDPAREVEQVIRGNAARFAATERILPADRTRQLIDRQKMLLEKHAPRLAARMARGRIRHVHGDLHLRNIAVINDRPVLFDCLEFDASLARIDVAYDLAFLLMDLWHRDLRCEANIVFNRYVDLSPEDEDSLALMPLFMSLRAAIRAHVLATEAQRGDPSAKAAAESYLGLAIDLLEPVAPRLLAIGGLSGTGKTTLARTLGGFVGPPPGARILRSDVLRKRAAGLKPEDPLPRSRYTAQAARTSYDRLLGMAEYHLTEGAAVLVDAAFARAEQRAAVAALAERIDLPFKGLWLEVARDTRLKRVRRRARDASDADEAVAAQQQDIVLAGNEPWTVLRVDGSPDDISARARAEIGMVRS